MSRIVADPAKLAGWAFGHDHWTTSAQIIRAMDRPNAKVIVKACHSSSKTFTAADVVLVALLKGYDVVTTAPTQEQVERLLWGHIRRAIDGSPVIDRASWGTVNLTEIRMPSGEFAIGLATKPEEGGVRFQGHHARPGSALVVVIDEAIGVSPGIMEAIEGFAAGGDVRRLYLCNPTIPSGPVYDIFVSEDPTWERITIDAFDTPNLAGVTLAELLAMPDHELDDNARPYLVTRRWVRDMWHAWGEDSPLWQSRVRGRFPVQADNSLISLAWLESARVDGEHMNAPLVAGIDVAGPGEDETVVCIQQLGRIVAMEAFTAPDARGVVTALLRKWLHEGLARVNYDEAGQGWYFGQHLREQLPERVVVNGVNVGEATTTPQNAEKFVNLKAELYWSLRERFRDGLVSGLTDQIAISQLAGLRYEHDSRGRVVIESKDKARKRGVKSPDRAEAVMLAFAPRDAREIVAGSIGQGARYGGLRAEPRRVQRGAARGRR